MAGSEPCLTDAQRTMLEIEGHWWKYAGAKDAAIRDRLSMSSTRYYLELNRLIDTPVALAHDPVLVKRLRRLRERRRQARRAS